MTPNVKGALLMVGSMAAYTVNDALVKMAGQDLPLFQLITLRGALATVLIYLLARHLGALRLSFPRHDKWLIVWRCLSELSATYFFLTALMHMPLANVTAVLQALPLTITLGAALIFFRAYRVASHGGDCARVCRYCSLSGPGLTGSVSFPFTRLSRCYW